MPTAGTAGATTWALGSAADVHGLQLRWLTSGDTPFEDIPEWAGQTQVRRQLLGDPTVDPFYWAPGELALDPRKGTETRPSLIRRPYK